MNRLKNIRKGPEMVVVQPLLGARMVRDMDDGGVKTNAKVIKEDSRFPCV